MPAAPLTASVKATSMDSGRSYELIGELGRGGFGAVFKARLLADAGFTKMVAIKMLHDEGSARPEFANRLRDEARLLARLRHRAIVAVDDLVRIEGRWAVVMEYVEGADLLSLIRQGPVPPRAALEIGVEVASALHVIHGATDPGTGRALGIVHRDLKPSNIRVTPHGEVKLLDFGIARAAFPGREAVTGSVRFESAGYVAPERLYGMDTPAVDVFSLGVVLYEMLAGDRLGPLPERQIPYEKARNQAFDALIARFPEQRLERIVGLIARAMAFEDRDRPEADQLANLMRDLLNDAPGEWLARWAPEAVRQVAGEQDLPSVSPEPLSVASLEAPAAALASTVGAPPPRGRHAAEVVPTAAPPAPTAHTEAALPPATRLALGIAGGLLLVGLLGAGLVIRMQMNGELEGSQAEPAVAGPAPTAPLEAPAPEAEAPAPQELASAAPISPPVVEPEVPAAAPEPAVQAQPAPAPAPKPTAAPEPKPAPAAPAGTAEATTAQAAAAPSTSSSGAGKTAGAGKASGTKAGRAAPAPATPETAAAEAVASLGTLVVEGKYNKAEWIDQSGFAHPPGAMSPGRYRLRVRFAEQLAWVETGVVVNLSAGQTIKVACSFDAEACRTAK